MTRPRWWARVAVGAAASVLPGAARRSRYRQEFTADLAGLRPVAQARYAAGVVAVAWALRSAITESLPIEEENDVKLFGRLLCHLGVHRWAHCRNAEDAAEYLECTRCRKEKDTMRLLDFSSSSPMMM